ncbi:unnamed protein product, partial [Ectocarpus sp. 12 AP-2014]
ATSRAQGSLFTAPRPPTSNTSTEDFTTRPRPTCNRVIPFIASVWNESCLSCRSKMQRSFLRYTHGARHHNGIPLLLLLRMRQRPRVKSSPATKDLATIHLDARQMLVTS